MYGFVIDTACTACTVLGKVLQNLVCIVARAPNTAALIGRHRAGTKLACVATPCKDPLWHLRLHPDHLCGHKAVFCQDETLPTW